MTQAIFDFISLAVDSLAKIFTHKLRSKEFLSQLFFVANESLFIIILCVCFAAIVTILESSFHMKLVIQNDSMVPGFAAVLILRELGAVVTALLIASRVGAGLAAEVGTMQVTEQIDAYRMLGLDPVHLIVVPRLLACILGTVFLVTIANSVCLFSAMLVSEAYLGFTPTAFLSAMKRFVSFQDIILPMIKGGFFGAVIPLISCFMGFRCRAGADGVGYATTQSVVMSSVAIIVIDFVLSYAFSYLY